MSRGIRSLEKETRITNLQLRVQVYALQAQNAALLALARAAEHLFRGEKYYSEFSGDDQIALWREHYHTAIAAAEGKTK